MSSSKEKAKEEQVHVSIENCEDQGNGKDNKKIHFSDLVLESLKEIDCKMVSLDRFIHTVDERVTEVQKEQQRQMDEMEKRQQRLMDEMQTPPELSTREKIQQALDQKRPVETFLCMQFLEEHGIIAYPSSQRDINKRNTRAKKERRTHKFIKKHNL
ncbi:uncharacterized protein LOC119683939 [Teleopsis dalmanni]|uniref:uncharacterized protein LOC119683939 n=1 Tax=Teleopsis dalmanni TaxID=139649 RepID=UPI000D32C1EE|nr:uncharacterized protein LOC119683939 [Teleopsis dalmanni]